MSFKLSYIKPGAQPQPYRKRTIYLLIKVNEEKLLAEPVLYCMVLSRLRHHPSLPRLRVRLSLSTRESPRHRDKLTSPLRQTNYFLASHYSYHSHVSFLQQLYSFLITAVFFSYNSCCKNNKKHKNCQSAVYR